MYNYVYQIFTTKYQDTNKPLLVFFLKTGYNVFPIDKKEVRLNKLYSDALAGINERF